MTTKCSFCQTEDPKAGFIKYSRRCRTCRSHWTRWYRIGITPAGYKKVWDAEKGVCAICGQSGTRKRPLHLDHDHKTDRIRGVLCASHNKGLGMFQDSIEGLLKAIEYLKRPQWDMKIKKNPKTSNPERHRQREIVHKFIVENPIGPTQTRARLLVAQTGWTLEKARTAIRRHKPHLDMAISSTFEPYLEQMP